MANDSISASKDKSETGATPAAEAVVKDPVWPLHNSRANRRVAEDEFGEFRVDDRVWTMNEIRDHPMFMNDINPGLNIEENPSLLALQSMVYGDQTPEEIAEHFRKLGNEAFRNSSNDVATQNALMLYTKGIEEECKDEKLNSTLHSNRAAVSTRMKEFDKAVNDCVKAIKCDPTNLKANFRGAKASEEMGLLVRALKFCDDGLTLSPGEKELKDMKKRLEKAIREEEVGRLKDKKLADQAVQTKGFQDAEAAQILGERGVELGPQLYDMAMYARGEPWKPRLSDDKEGVEWAILFLYDETSQSDFVQCFDERCTLLDQLDQMFPADRPVDWDSEAKYKPDDLDAFMEYYPDGATETSLMRIDTGAPLQDVLRELKVPPCLPMHVLVRDSAACRHFCKTNDIVER